MRREAVGPPRPSSMLKWTISYVFNRLLILGVLIFGISAYFHSTCGGFPSILEQVERISDGLKAISRVLH
jgi:hypothetical protein